MTKLTIAEIREQAMKAVAAAQEAKAKREAENAARTQEARKDLQVQLTKVAAGTQVSVQRVFTGAGFVPQVAGVTYNDEQSQALELGMRGKSFCLIGAAGTGKTTTTQELILQLLRMPHISPFDDSSQYLQKGEPGIVIVSFTNKAVNNIKKKLPKNLQHHCITMHKLIEFAPERDEAGKIIGFAPGKNRNSPLPYISCVIFEESSMISTELYGQYRRALPEGCAPQEIFLGDLNQLPPVFGEAILGFKLIELPTVELVQVYRQALQSPIISLAHRVREGKTFNWEADEKGTSLQDAGEHGMVLVRRWQKRVNDVVGIKTMGAVMLQYMDQGLYDPKEDIILCPFNVKFGCEELNKIIANRLAKDRNAVTWHVIARGTSTFWAVGDKVLFNQMDAVIIDIRPAAGYTGKLTLDESEFLDRWGNYTDGGKHEKAPQKSDLELLETLESQPIGERDKNSASHVIKLQYVDSGQTSEISASGDINKMLLGYAITVHKSQGSEWNRVFIALHYSHTSIITRELMYTAITRAKKQLIMFIDPGKEGSMDSISKAARSPEIKGVTLAEKAQFFKGKIGTYQEHMYGTE